MRDAVLGLVDVADEHAHHPVDPRTVIREHQTVGSLDVVFVKVHAVAVQFTPADEHWHVEDNGSREVNEVGHVPPEVVKAEGFDEDVGWEAEDEEVEADVEAQHGDANVAPWV
jgi:hypothetical protein